VLPGLDLDVLAATLIRRHASALSQAELRRSLRALSARYVEARATLGRRSPLDTAGKRAAFAVFYGPLHFVTMRAIVERLDLRDAPCERIVDLGCGTGMASAAWALATRSRPSLIGFDRNQWAVSESRWTWRALGLSGRASRADLLAGLARCSRGRLDRLGVLAAWSVNELPVRARADLLEALQRLSRRGARVLVVEPIATSTAPWWPEWAAAARDLGGRADSWSLPNDLPPVLTRLDRDAGFDRAALKARSLLI
jgi:SAM-dependent methyltransferase